MLVQVAMVTGHIILCTPSVEARDLSLVSLAHVYSMPLSLTCFAETNVTSLLFANQFGMWFSGLKWLESYQSSYKVRSL